jgi:hypothetical protein
MSSKLTETEIKFWERMTYDVEFARIRQAMKEKEDSQCKAQRNFKLKLLNAEQLEVLRKELQSELDDSLSHAFRQYLSEYLSCVENQLSTQKKWEENQEVIRECFKAYRGVFRKIPQPSVSLAKN